jgi:phosphatidylserine/phosphatidylglycerophosphate/cardiolipin synthase-like enzyme
MTTSRPDRVVIAPGRRREAVLDVIRQARSHIGLSLFRANDEEIFAELERAVDRGVEVEVIVTSRARGGKKKRRKLWKALEATGAAIFPYTDPVVKYHAKYLVADDGPAMVSSLNFTRKCFNKTCDAILVTHDPAVAGGLRQLMAADRLGHPIPDGLTERLIIGPERARRQLTRLIEGARTSIDLLDAKLSDPGLVALLNARRTAGIAVGLYEARRYADLVSHGKMMLIDKRVAVIGSLALAALSLDFRREVAIVVEEPTAVAEIEELFRFVAAAAAKEADVAANAEGGAVCCRGCGRCWPPER